MFNLFEGYDIVKMMWFNYFFLVFENIKMIDDDYMVSFSDKFSFSVYDVFVFGRNIRKIS